MRLAQNHLHRTGYRLPTEAEWECACRAGAKTTWAFGEAEELGRKYAHCGNPSGKSHPVGALRPNDLGLFDLHGNASEWCREIYSTHVSIEAVPGDSHNPEIIANRDARVLRGGSFLIPPFETRSASRSWGDPANRLNEVGFRTARTIQWPAKTTDEELLNKRAWFFATCPNETVRQRWGRERIIQDANRACSNSRSNPQYLGTLAAAYAANGDFEKAIEWQSRALELGYQNYEETERARKRLALFEQHKPYRVEGH